MRPHPWKIALPCLVALVMLVAAALHAAPPARTVKIAVLTPGLSFGEVLTGFREGLAQLGYRENGNLSLLVEDTKGAGADVKAQAQALVAANPDVLVTVGTSHTVAAKGATSTIPIVFTWVGDPVRSGLVAGYASSGNNLTGLSVYSGPLSGKRLEILKEMAPGARRALCLVAKESIAEISFSVAQKTADQLGLTLIRRDVASRDDIVRELGALPRGAFDAIYHVPSGLVSAHIGLLIQRAREDRVALMAHEDALVTAGALVSYGANYRQMGQQTARVVDRVLAGVAPAEIPIQIPDKLMLSINLVTARAIGLKPPLTLLERAERIVE
ncbi:MAG TPA: ABC transporter substrate-binding protein [Methylomirabilota bacterium]|nr:ABC transporter substrate-binding protein [Methylomirabilota bacterium]